MPLPEFPPPLEFSVSEETRRELSRIVSQLAKIFRFQAAAFRGMATRDYIARAAVSQEVAIQLERIKRKIDREP